MKNSLTKITLAVVAILFAFTTKAQTYCVTPPPPNNLVVQDSNYRTQIQPPTCGDLSGFITPNNPLTFRVNFHFFRPTTGNPYYNTAYDYYKNVTSDDCDTLIKIINQRMAVFNAPDKPVSGVTSRTNSYVKYQIAKDSFLFHSNWVYLPHVLFHTNDTAWSPGYGTSDYLYNRYKVNPATEINIFFTADLTNPGSGAGLAGHVMISALPWVPTGWRTFNHILDMQLLLHELGHSAGLLCHTDRSFIPLNTPANIFPLNINTDYFVESDCGCDGSTSPCTPSPNPCTTWGNVSSVSQGGVSSNNIMGYNNDRHYLSPNQIGSFFYGARAGVTSKYVVNYTGNQCQYDSSKTINIRNDTTWSSAVIVNGDVVIQPGKTLTIHCTAYFSQHSRVLVMPAAKLVIDGGILTALCDSTWSGVQVWGNSTKSQAMSLNIHTQTVRAVYQGYVSIINGGTIQNAQVGITTIAKYNNGNTDWNKTGGIIEGTSANFIGNTKDVEFMYYQADVSASTFANCNFNQNGLKLSDSWPDARVSLYGIKGVTFYGNTFSALGGLTPTSPHFNLIDNGITSIDASYTINDNNATHNTFKAFKYGINAQNTAIFNPITVNNTTFNQCFTGGVYLNAMHYSTITNCTFNIWPALGTLSVPVYGVYLDASHGYSVRGNKLNGSTINSYIHTGIIVNNSGTGSNSIYNNTFTKLYYGLWAQDVNQGGGPISPGQTGLLMNCNDFITCTYNIGVMGTAPGAGVAAAQGVHNVPAQYARNTYSTISCTDKNTYHIDTAHVGYQLTHASFSGFPYQPLPQGGATGCSPSSARILLQQDAGTYSKSTYCPANCTGCRTMPQIQQSLVQHKKNMLNLVQDENYTAKQQDIVDKINYDQNELGNLANEKIRNFLNDTSLHAAAIDSVIAVLKQKHNANWRKQLATAYIHKADFANAQTHLDSLRNEDATAQDFYNMAQHLMAYRQNPPAFIQRLKNNPGLKTELLTLANNRTKESCTYAQTLLKLAFGMKFQEPFIAPKEDAATRLAATATNPIELSDNVKLYPNPAQTNLYIEYVTDESSNNQLQITDISGRNVKSTTLNNSVKLNMVDVNDLPNGIYFVTLLQNNRPISTKKIVIMR